jgi:hypothetical protein
MLREESSIAEVGDVAFEMAQRDILAWSWSGGSMI